MQVDYTNLVFEEQGSYPTQNGDFVTTVFTAVIRINYKVVLWRTTEVATGNFTESTTIDSTYTAFLDNTYRVPEGYGDSQPKAPNGDPEVVPSRDPQ